MAMNQTRRCKLERLGVRKILSLLHIRQRQIYTAPFDIVTSEFGYEVKTLSWKVKDKKVHIADSSLKLKLKFAEANNIQIALFAVVVDKNKRFHVYQSELKQNIRISQMKLIA